MSSQIGRRRLLTGLLSCGALAAAGPWRLLEGLSATDGAELALRIGTLLRDTTAGATVGLAYVTSVPQEAKVNVLLARLGGGNAARLREATDEQLRALLATQTLADFSAGRTVIVNGWVLAVTEARLCAATALAVQIPR